MFDFIIDQQHSRNINSNWRWLLICTHFIIWTCFCSHTSTYCKNNSINQITIQSHYKVFFFWLESFHKVGDHQTAYYRAQSRVSILFYADVRNASAVAHDARLIVALCRTGWYHPTRMAPWLPEHWTSTAQDPRQNSTVMKKSKFWPHI